MISITIVDLNYQVSKVFKDENHDIVIIENCHEPDTKWCHLFIKDEDLINKICIIFNAEPVQPYKGIPCMFVNEDYETVLSKIEENEAMMKKSEEITVSDSRWN